mgnify:CR=1 FL=1|tara:strand:+ start:514 stop:726 length:213 start_codon:yes stop_codon:yes gene_type:complete
MNPDSTRKAIRRSILKQEGARRVDVILDKTDQANLALIRDEYGCKESEAVRLALASLSGQIRTERHPEGF